MTSPLADTQPTESSEIGGGYARYVLTVLIVVYVFNFIDRQILSILAEEIKADLGLADADIGFLYGTAFAVFYAIFGIPLGKLADVWHRMRLISLGLAFWSLATAASGAARNFAMLATFRFGVGIGEASASPAAFSVLSDYFPPRLRATVTAIYSSGIYIGAGIGLFLGGYIVESWHSAYPDPAAAPLGLKAWQAAFVLVGLPGLLLSLLVWTLREPVRGVSEGLVTEPEPHPFRVTLESLASVLPPLTLLSLLRAGGLRALLQNLLLALVIGTVAFVLNTLTATPLQWTALGLGVYAAGSWFQGQALSDPATFTMMFRSRAFVFTTIGFPLLSFITYGVGFWSPPLMLRLHNVPLAEAGLLLGLGAAIGGLVGVSAGGWLADKWRQRHVNARLYIGLLVPVLSIPPGLGFIFAPNPTVAYVCSFVFSIFSPMWLGAVISTVNDLVLPRMRATASAWYILMNTFVGLALGPYAIGQLSDALVAGGAGSGGALQVAMASSLGVYALSVLFLLLALPWLARDEASRLERARSAGEPV